MAWKLSERSRANLKGVHPDLQKIIRRACHTSRVDFTVLEGLRSPDRQRQLVKQGASKIDDSRHLHGFAVDLGVWESGQISWHWPLYIVLAAGVKQAALEVALPVIWGGDWPHFKDGGHFELPRAGYPDPA